jgi:hypothetical protein
MRATTKLSPIIGLAVGLIALCVASSAVEPPASTPPFSFNGAQYLHRWSGKDQYEFTPPGQEDLNHWSDMITVDPYPTAKDGDALAAMANGVLANYKKDHGKILGTHSVPRTADHPAEHFVAAVLGAPGFLEAVFVRFRMADGIGCAYVYSHRFYGPAVGMEMAAWLKANGPLTETALMSAQGLPSPVTVH